MGYPDGLLVADFLQAIEEEGWSQEEAAEAIEGVTQSDVSRWQREDWKSLTAAKRRSLEQFLRGRKVGRPAAIRESPARYVGIDPGSLLAILDRESRSAETRARAAEVEAEAAKERAAAARIAEEAVKERAVAARLAEENARDLRWGLLSSDPSDLEVAEVGQEAARVDRQRPASREARTIEPEPRGRRPAAEKARPSAEQGRK